VLLPRRQANLARDAKVKEHAMSQQLSAKITVIGVDIGKNSFHVVGLDQRGAIVLRQKWSRGQVESRFANMPPCLIGMEACVGAHHLSRKLKALGHDTKLMPAKYVRPYSKGQKNDFRDAEAIAEAVQRPTMSSWRRRPPAALAVRQPGFLELGHPAMPAGVEGKRGGQAHRIPDLADYLRHDHGRVGLRRAISLRFQDQRHAAPRQLGEYRFRVGIEQHALGPPVRSRNRFLQRMQHHRAGLVVLDPDRIW
jgi:hypothetical protein